MTGIEAALVGRVASDTIELKTSQAGKPWTAFSIGVGEGDTLEWVRISVFGAVAERLAGELTKGQTVYCEGRLQLWRARKDGVEKASLQIAAWKVEKVGISAIGRNKPKRSRQQAADAQDAEPAQTPSTLSA
jgi:single-stranded DNA-binding protein